ncbi:hypothetical protein B0T10DRAFT_317412 [Thelonectria olida]|uniref:Secreted protein n=1 Tax=Thelonectria olida TaxID=1576542 RepID=A0A9P9APX0_9HYPO|nr:hypothetical protein B0T10DRAFT_317412 [Thelonectria olida]
MLFCFFFLLSRRNCWGRCALQTKCLLLRCSATQKTLAYMAKKKKAKIVKRRSGSKSSSAQRLARTSHTCVLQLFG